MPSVKVDLGKASYDILIGSGLMEKLPEFVRKNNFSHTALIVSDTNVYPLYGKTVETLLAAGGIKAKSSVILAGEVSKSLAVAENIYTAAIEAGLDRNSLIVALGGGVVGDMAGFIAATYMRGVPFIQIPTSLLADVDSSVGGKVAVNHRLGKNLIGAFYQPKAVFIDTNCLKTLPPREINTGLGEIVKYGIISDAELFNYLENNAARIKNLEPAAIDHIITRSCEIKAAVVSADEKDHGLRQILNFGHTIGHAIEKETAYSRYNHGEAVAIGLIGAAHISREIGLLPEAVFARIESLIEKLELPVFATGATVEAMYADIFHDKKAVNGTVSWVLAKGLGETVVRKDIAEDTVKRAMDYCLAEPAMRKR